MPKVSPYKVIFLTSMILAAGALVCWMPVFRMIHSAVKFDRQLRVVKARFASYTPENWLTLRDACADLAAKESDYGVVSARNKEAYQRLPVVIRVTQPLHVSYSVGQVEL